MHLRYKNSAKHPLNNYGEGPFCEFDVPADIGDKKGIYIFVVNDKVKYLGRCLNTFRKRVSEGYGHISPRNCFKGGQPTNCTLIESLIRPLRKEQKFLSGYTQWMIIQKFAS